MLVYRCCYYYYYTAVLLLHTIMLLVTAAVVLRGYVRKHRRRWLCSGCPAHIHHSLSLNAEDSNAFDTFHASPLSTNERDVLPIAHTGKNAAHCDANRCCFGCQHVGSRTKPPYRRYNVPTNETRDTYHIFPQTLTRPPPTLYSNIRKRATTTVSAPKENIVALSQRVTRCLDYIDNYNVPCSQEGSGDCLSAARLG